MPPAATGSCWLRQPGIGEYQALGPTRHWGLPGPGAYHALKPTRTWGLPGSGPWGLPWLSGTGAYQAYQATAFSENFYYFS